MFFTGQGLKPFLLRSPSSISRSYQLLLSLREPGLMGARTNGAIYQGRKIGFQISVTIHCVHVILCPLSLYSHTLSKSIAGPVSIEGFIFTSSMQPFYYNP